MNEKHRPGMVLAASLFEWAKAVAAPVAGATAIVIAAVIAARTANSRQETQLQGEFDRQKALLDSESARLEQQLEHDRETRDSVALRETLIRGAETLTALIPPLAGISQAYVDNGPAAEPVIAIADSGLEEALGRAMAATEPLEVLLGWEEPASKTYRQSVETVLEFRAHATRAVVDQGTRESRQAKTERAHLEFNTARAAYMNAATSLAGVAPR